MAAAQQVVRTRTSFSAVFCAFVLGGVIAMGLAAAAAIWITDAPIPFVTKVKTVNEADEQALKGIDPNQPLQQQSAAAESAAASSAATQAAASPAGTQASGKASYWVDLGSFPNEKAADSMRDKVAFMGLDAVVQKTVVSGRTTWKAVMGPYESAQDAEQINQNLAASGVNGTISTQP